MLLQDPPHGLFPLKLPLSPQVEDKQSQQDEEEHHTTHCSRYGRTRSKQRDAMLYSEGKDYYSPRNSARPNFK